MAMKAVLGTGFACGLALSCLSFPALADPPQLTGPNGPVVQFFYGPENTALVTSERGLSIAVGNLADLAVEFDDGTGPTAINLFSEPGGVIGAGRPARYAPESGVDSLPPPPNPGIDVTYTTDAFGYRLTRTAALVETALDGGAVARARLGASGPVLASAAGPTLAAARAAALADTALDGFRADITAVQVVAAAPSVTTTETTASVLSGRDTYLLVPETIGPNAPNVMLTGNVGLCATPLTDCEGGIAVNVPNGAIVLNTITLQDLYVTDTLTRVVTTVQNYFLNIFLTGGNVAPHVGAQAAGMEGSEAFLARLGQESAVRANAPSAQAAGAGQGMRFFADVSGAGGKFGQIGVIEHSGWSMAGLTAGAAADLGNGWTIGAAIEAGQWGWSGEGSTAKGDSRKLGMFAGWQNGPWSVAAEGFIGQSDVKTRDTLDVTADYKVNLGGLGIEAAYAIDAGDWVITPRAALRWVAWNAPTVTDSVGGVIDARRTQQLRPEIGVAASRRFVLDKGALDLGLEARAWTVTGDRTGLISAGLLTGGPETGSGGALGFNASWQLGNGTALTAKVEQSFGNAGNKTTGRIGARIAF
jgi:Autotransporter beta-domain